MFQTQPEFYYKKFIKGEGIPEIAEEVAVTNQQNLAQVQLGGLPAQPQVPTPTNTTQIPTVPAGSPRNLIGRAVGGIKKLLRR